MLEVLHALATLASDVAAHHRTLDSFMRAILERLDHMSATEQQLKDLIDGIRDGLPKIGARLDTLTATVTDLKNQIATGIPGPVSAAQLDELIAETGAISQVIATLGTVPVDVPPVVVDLTGEGSNASPAPVVE